MGLYVDAFDAARAADPAIRVVLEDEILDELLPLAPIRVLDLLPDAEPMAQSRVYASLMDLAYLRADNALAAHVFAAAVQYYEAHPDTQIYHWGLANLIAGSYQQLPSALVLHAIDVTLAQSEQVKSPTPAGPFSASRGEGTRIAFNSNYDFQLFAVIPALQRFDPARAAELLSEHTEVAAEIKRYPKGLVSLDEAGLAFSEPNFSWPFHRVGYHPMSEGQEAYNAIGNPQQTLSALDLGLEFTIPRDTNALHVTGFVNPFADSGDSTSRINVTQSSEFRIDTLTDEEFSILQPAASCPSDIAHRLELAMAAPLVRKECRSFGGPLSHPWCYSERDDFPRADLVQALAERCTFYSNPAGARLALHDQVDGLEQLPEVNRLDYLDVVADLYLRLGDRQSAADVVQSGFAAAHALYDRDSASGVVAKLPKGVWPSAEAYRRVITLGVNADLDVTRRAVDQIADPALGELERVMMARALLGVPIGRYMIVYPNSGLCTVGIVDTHLDTYCNTLAYFSASQGK